MKKIININWLLVLCIVSWTALAGICMFYAYKFFETSPKKELPAKIISLEVVEEKPDDLFLKSLDLCKKEFSEELAKAIFAASQKYNVPIPVIYAIVATESGKHAINDINEDNVLNVKQNAVSKANCVGLMQLSKYAVAEYNKTHNTKYSLEDVLNININIEIGTWHFKQFQKIASNWSEMYMIYNVGYSEYNKVNDHWFLSWDGKWHNEKKNSFFYKNDFMPPNDNNHGVYGKNLLRPYNARKRFEVCYKVCKEYFDA